MGCKQALYKGGEVGCWLIVIGYWCVRWWVGKKCASLRGGEADMAISLPCHASPQPPLG